MRKRIWRLWAKALGQKATDDDKESDVVENKPASLYK